MKFGLGNIPWNKGKTIGPMAEETRRKLSASRVGVRPWNVGIQHTEETKKKISEANSGRRPSPEALLKMSAAQKGRKHSEETKRKIALSNKGKKKPPFSPEHRRKISEANTGRKFPIEFSLKISKRVMGEKNPSWKGGVYPKNKLARHTMWYRLWREMVFKRDNWTCQCCGRRGGVLNADHKKRFAEYPELRHSVDNGRTLCVECHRKTDTYGTKIGLWKPQQSTENS